MAHALKVPRTKKSPAGLAAQRRRAAAERMRGMLGRDPTRSYTDELIAERRREARADCIEIAKLRPKTIAQGLSLADRACLVLAARLGVPALTADSIWTQAETPAEVKLVR